MADIDLADINKESGTLSSTIRFLGHQVISTLGVAIFFLSIVSLPYSMRLSAGVRELLHHALRIAIGMALGVVIYTKLQDRSMMWVWIGPLLFVFASIYSFQHATRLPIAAFWTITCGPYSHGCEYRVASLSLLVGAVGYSIGAWASKRLRRGE